MKCEIMICSLLFWVVGPWRFPTTTYFSLSAPFSGKTSSRARRNRWWAWLTTWPCWWSRLGWRVCTWQTWMKKATLSLATCFLQYSFTPLDYFLSSWLTFMTWLPGSKAALENGCWLSKRWQVSINGTDWWVYQCTSSKQRNCFALPPGGTLGAEEWWREEGLLQQANLWDEAEDQGLASGFAVGPKGDLDWFLVSTAGGTYPLKGILLLRRTKAYTSCRHKSNLDLGYYLGKGGSLHLSMMDQ